MFSSHLCEVSFFKTPAAQNAQLVAQMQSLRQANGKLLLISLIDFSRCLKKRKEKQLSRLLALSRNLFIILFHEAKKFCTLNAPVLLVIQQSILPSLLDLLLILSHRTWLRNHPYIEKHSGPDDPALLLTKGNRSVGCNNNRFKASVCTEIGSLGTNYTI